MSVLALALALALVLAASTVERPATALAMESTELTRFGGQRPSVS
jgi:hypothetical protein